MKQLTWKKKVCFTPSDGRLGGMPMVHWDNVTPGSREEFLRALVYILETKKLTHLSFAIAKAASEETPSDLNERELTALIDLAKRMLLEIGELALAE